VELKFTKVSGLGNDFILIDNRDGKLIGDEREFFRKICQRRIAVGSDGVILLEKSDRADFKYRHFNSDGSRAEMCGNGARCIAYYAVQKGIADSSLLFEMNDVIYQATVEQNNVSIQMPSPTEIRTDLNIKIENSLSLGGFVRIGVPHLVLFSDDVMHLDVNEIGRKYRYHPAFTEGTNVNFVQIVDSRTIKIRTYERGVEAETLACGTGAVSSGIISFVQKNIHPPISVITMGGFLTIEFADQFNPLYLIGEAKIVYEAEMIDLDLK